MWQRYKVITVAPELAYLPATRAVAQTIDRWARVLHKPLLYSQAAVHALNVSMTIAFPGIFAPL
jgi:hypothetical protein